MCADPLRQPSPRFGFVGDAGGAYALGADRTSTPANASQPRKHCHDRDHHHDRDNRGSAVDEATGVVVGPFGFAEAYEQKIETIRPWLNDKRAKVRNFSRLFIESLERISQDERRRAQEKIELRKHEYGVGNNILMRRDGNLRVAGGSRQLSRTLGNVWGRR